MGRPLGVHTALTFLAITVAAVSLVVLGANAAACSSFSEEPASPDGGGSAADATAGDTAVPPDGATPDGSSGCLPLACPTTTPSLCDAFDVAPDAKWHREPGGEISGLFFPKAGCNGGGGLRVSGAAVTDLSSDLFVAEVGTTKASGVRVVFDVLYELTGSFGAGDPYLDILQVSTAPRSGRAGSFSVGINAAGGEAGVNQPGQPSQTKAFPLSHKQWHRVEVTARFGTAAKLELVIDGAAASPVILESSLEVGGSPETGVAVALGRSSQGSVPAITLAFDNVAITGQ